MAIEIFNLFDILYIVPIVVVINQCTEEKPKLHVKPNTKVIVVQQLLVYLKCGNGIS